MAIQGFLDSRDVFIVLPTGFGKTACFVCLPHAFDLYYGRSLENKSIVIVVSPLTSLIHDQVQSLLKRDLSAGFLDSEASLDNKKNVLKRDYSIVFMSPELLVEKWRVVF